MGGRVLHISAGATAPVEKRATVAAQVANMSVSQLCKLADRPLQIFMATAKPLKLDNLAKECRAKLQRDGQFLDSVETDKIVMIEQMATTAFRKKIDRMARKFAKTGSIEVHC